MKKDRLTILKNSTLNLDYVNFEGTRYYTLKSFRLNLIEENLILSTQQLKLLVHSTNLFVLQPPKINYRTSLITKQGLMQLIFSKKLYLKTNYLRSLAPKIVILTDND